MVVEWWFNGGLMVVEWWLNGGLMVVEWWSNGGWNGGRMGVECRLYVV